MNSKTVKPTTSAKLLGVIFDQELQWKEHIRKAIKSATQTHLRYLRTVQRTALIRILSAFRTVATTTLEVEAHILPTYLRLRHRAQSTITRLHTLQQDHPIWSTLQRAQKRWNNIGSAQAFTEIEIEPDREIAAQRAEIIRSTSDIVVYSDTSGRQGHLGAAAVTLNNKLEVSGSLEIQILHAINIVKRVASGRPSSTGEQVRLATILSDSMSALQAIQNPGNKSGQGIIHLLFVSNGYQGIAQHPGTIQRAVWRNRQPYRGKTGGFCPLLSREKAFVHKDIHIQLEKEWKESRADSHLRTNDNTLPAKYTRRLYGPLTRNRAYLLRQLLTGHCWLSTFGKAFRFQGNDRCICGDREILKHVLWDCPALRVLRWELQLENINGT
ncbi:hypothetical protein N7481_002925 [Penicillium waksmanii]|uniref:uncharacterized protein n=1 Tax=Penicillium waksmanii TaxID=69791 RepID=UPI0025487E0F|nr:uncharacterized protein N7481_002925 [Penicillium waksmanii]KAJ5987715.1 hypothetical protein N7481_002925 [Penicillium waksmanii]